MKKIIFLVIFLISISSAFSLTQVIAGVDRNITFPITNGTNNPLSGATCNINTYYPNITLKDFQLSSNEANTTNADGVYFVTLGSTYSENETGIYTLNAVCTSLGETGAGSIEFAIVKKQYSFIDTMWQLALMLGMIGFTVLFFWKSEEFVRVPDPDNKKQRVKDEFLNMIVRGFNIGFVLITVGLMHFISLENASENIQNITYIPYQMMLWFLLIYIIYNTIMFSFRAVKNLVDD